MPRKRRSEQDPFAPGVEEEAYGGTVAPDAPPSPFGGVQDVSENSVDMSRPRGWDTQGAVIEERRAYAMQLRRQGASMRQIAQAIRSDPRFPNNAGYSAGSASQDIEQALSQIRSESLKDAILLRQLELERLDELQARYWGRALSGDYLSLDKVLAIMDRRAKYTGLYEPTRYEVMIDWERLSPAQMQRLAEGEDPYSVVMEGEYRIDDVSPGPALPALTTGEETT